MNLEWKKPILDKVKPGCVFWQLRAMREGGAVDLHPILSIEHDEFPLVPSGTYFLVFYDAQRRPIGGAQQLEWELPASTPASRVPASEGQIHADGIDATFGVDLDTVARQELEQRKLSENQRGTLEYYNRLMQVLGARGVQEVNDKTAQTERFVRFAHKTVEDYIDLLERTTERMQRYQAPPPPPEPPPWDRIIAALAPSVAVIYTETVRAIKGAPPAGSAPGLESLLLPSIGQSEIYEVLGQVGSVEKLTTLLQDKEKLAAWLLQIEHILKAKPGGQAEETKAGSKANTP